jgi:hypothetical protein
MKAFEELVNTKRSRLGFHYYPNSLHYSEKDAEIWIPQLDSLGLVGLFLSVNQIGQYPKLSFCVERCTD